MDEGGQGPKVQRPLMGCSAQGPTAEGGSSWGGSPEARKLLPLPWRPLWSSLVRSPARLLLPSCPRDPLSHSGSQQGPPRLAARAGSASDTHTLRPPQTCCFRGPGVGRRSGDPRHTLGSEGRCRGTGQVGSVPTGAAVGPHHSRNTTGDLRALSAGWGSAASP